jgi:hypothetical protein
MTNDSWEGEKWYHYFETDEETKVVDLLAWLLDRDNDLIELETFHLTEGEATVLANLEAGYMYIHWFGELTDFEGLANATSEDLYKGGIRKYGVEVFGYDDEDQEQ